MNGKHIITKASILFLLMVSVSLVSYLGVVTVVSAGYYPSDVFQAMTFVRSIDRCDAALGVETVAVPPMTDLALEDPPGNILVYDNPEDQMEPSIAVNPLDPYNIVVGANDLTPYGAVITGYEDTTVWTGYYWTTDGGDTWDHGLIPRTADMQDDSCDPGLAFDSDGNVYYVGLNYDMDVGWGPNNVVFVSKSTDGGQTFSNPVTVSDGRDDKPAIAVDTTGGTYDGYVYVTWTNWDPDTELESIMFSSSSDGGLTWSDPIRISPADFLNNQGSAIAVGPNGEVYVAWGRLSSGRIDSLYEMHLAVSYDGGEHFTQVGSVAAVTALPEYLPNTWARTNSYPTIDVDRSTGQNRGNVYIAWADNRFGDADILIESVKVEPTAVLIDGPHMVNDDKLPYTQNDVDQFFPSLSVAPNGRIDVIFYDRRDDVPDHHLFGVYYSNSTGVLSVFSENMEVTTELSDPDVWGSMASGGAMGDYIDVVSTNEIVYAVWTDGRDGTASPTADMDGNIYVAIFPSDVPRLPIFIIHLPPIYVPMLPDTQYDIELDVDVFPVHGFSEQVVLDAWGNPPWMKIAFSPLNGTPPFTTTMRIYGKSTEPWSGEVVVAAVYGFQTRTTSFSFEVLEGPFINLGTIAGDPGQTMSIVGQGFAPLSEVEIKFDNTVVATTMSDDQGSISTSFIIPETAGSIHTVTATDELGNSASASLQVPIPMIEAEREAPADIALMPDTGFASTTIAGSGFSAHSEITITWDGTPIPTVPSPLTADSDGNFTAIISVPTPNDPGAHVVNATDEKGRSAEATFTVVDMTGPEGPQGETGPQGPEGLPGPQGELGPAGAVPLWSVAAIAVPSIIAIFLAAYAILKKKP